jgi:hypothetical protein
MLLICFGYLTWAMLQGEHYYADPYLSPAYSPVFLYDPNVAGAAPAWHVWFGEFPDWWPWFIPASPAALILVFPGAFRGTCYYYRKAYYRALFGSPPGCSVNPLLKGIPYQGETAIALFQNLHRYALYPALVINVILFYDAFVAFFKDGEFGIGVGSIVLTINAVLLALYSFGCHSFRHLIGGGDNAMSCGEMTLKYGAWRKATWCNSKHMQIAWMSLGWVTFTEFYVRMVSMGYIHDFNTWN